MTRRIPAAVLVALGVIVLVLAVLSVTAWRPDDRAVLSLPARPEQPLVVSDAGVLDAVADEVTITATADNDQQVVLAVGRTADVDAWVGETPSLHITGLRSWEELAVEESAGGGRPPAEGEPPAEEGPPSPAGSDLWVTESTGAGRTELEWEHRSGRWSLIAATDGAAAAPRVTLAWPVEVRTPWLVPGIVVGALLLLAGGALLLLDLLARREAERRRAAASERAEARATADASETAVITPVAAAGLTRRQLREQARAQGEVDERAGRQRRGLGARRPGPGESGAATTEARAQAGPARGAGVVPGVPERYRPPPGVPERYRPPPDAVSGAAPDRSSAAEPPAPGTGPGPTAPRPAGAPPAQVDEGEPEPSDDDSATSQWRSLWGVTGPAQTGEEGAGTPDTSRTPDEEADR